MLRGSPLAVHLCHGLPKRGRGAGLWVHRHSPLRCICERVEQDASSAVPQVADGQLHRGRRLLRWGWAACCHRSRRCCQHRTCLRLGCCLLGCYFVGYRPRCELSPTHHAHLHCREIGTHRVMTQRHDASGRSCSPGKMGWDCIALHYCTGEGKSSGYSRTAQERFCHAGPCNDTQATRLAGV